MTENDTFDLLADRYLRGELTQSEQEELATLLETDASLVGRLKGQLLIDGVLKQAGTGRGPLPSDLLTPLVSGVQEFRRPQSRPPRWQRPRPLLFAVTGVASLLAAIVLILWFSCGLLPSIQSGKPLVRQPARLVAGHFGEKNSDFNCDAVATITQLENVVWKQGSPRHASGAIISPGWIRIESGSVTLEFFCGAQVRLVGPADFMAVTRDLGYCSRGVLTAAVPPQAIGFTIDAPQMTVIDRGTEFLLDVTSELSQVQVLKGAVELDQIPSGLKQLREGEGMLVSSDGQVKAFSGDVIAANLRATEKGTDLELRCARRNEVRSRLDQEPETLIHFDMKPEEGTTLSNRASSGRSLVGEGTRVRCDWGAGSLPHTSSLGFRRVADRVRILVPQELNSFSLFTRVRLDSFDRESSSLLTSDEIRRCGLAWQLTRHASEDSPVLRLDVYDEMSGQICHYDAVLPLTTNDLGQWFSLATVVDSQSNRVCHYLNGTLLCQQERMHTSPVRIGFAELGNAASTEGGGDYLMKTLGGAMDEFVLTARTLSGEELDQLN
ncbi:MAG: hypothetical protein Q4G68_14175 [Planctomycetia bacterium]|nr:hypothetical protein [Planctomycetia bacterium]